MHHLFHKLITNEYKTLNSQPVVSTKPPRLIAKLNLPTVHQVANDVCRKIKNKFSWRITSWLKNVGWLWWYVENLSPSDYHMLPAVEQVHGGHKIEAAKGVATGVARWLGTNVTDWCQQRIQKVVPRCDKCLYCGGATWRSSWIAVQFNWKYRY